MIYIYTIFDYNIHACLCLHVLAYKIRNYLGKIIMYVCSAQHQSQGIVKVSLTIVYVSVSIYLEKHIITSTELKWSSIFGPITASSSPATPTSSTIPKRWLCTNSVSICSKGGLPSLVAGLEQGKSRWASEGNPSRVFPLFLRGGVKVKAGH